MRALWTATGWGCKPSVLKPLKTQQAVSLLRSCNMGEMRARLSRLAAISSFMLATWLWAQTPKPPASSSSRSSSKAAAHASIATPDAGAITDGAYRNRFFGFSYKIPYGWVARTKEMQEDVQDNSQSQSSLVLLAFFQRPPEAAGDTVNSAVVIVAESISSYPGLKTAADYFEPMTELTTSKGFKIVNEPYQFPVGAKQLVRGDFSKVLGTVTMRQASLVALEKGYVVSFTFIGGSEDEIAELVEKLSFGMAKAPMTKNSARPH